MAVDPKQWLPTLVLVPLVGLLLYRRLKTTFGRQPVRRTKMIARMVLLGVVAAVVLVTSAAWSSLAMAGAVAAGVAGGVALAWYSLRHTVFETTDGERFYTANKWIGLGITALFLGRLAARLIAVYEAVSTHAAGQPMDLHRSPITVAIVLLMVGYYVVYYAGILRRRP